MKYVIFDIDGVETPIIFEEFINHEFFVNKYSNVVSAGFVKIYGGPDPSPDFTSMERTMMVDVFGGSTSLKLKSRPEDEEIIFNAIHRHYK